ncbi:unnamed protein product [Allacma fusca]|uniref:Peptidase S1 domain-containing protein n=1 Tax=Allacma fusca TaxID=39272 RepID=A0A8J2L5B8_9HEXA|nr:unnamed protein product [Allacma fusca]
MDTHPILVDKIISHESYNNRTFDNDISLLHLAEDLDFTNPRIKAACLPYGMDGQYDTEDVVVASGWGTLKEGGSPSNVLRKVRLQMITNDRCKRMHDSDKYNDGYSISNIKLCAYALNKDTCQGDSGGSVDWQDSDGTFYALGIVSNGHGCAREGMPGIYTRVNEYLPWIEQKTMVSFCKYPNNP